jgi:large subunit ribosomal protein L4
VKAKVINIDKKAAGDVDLSDEVFSARVNETLIYEATKMQRANKRKGCASCKNRSQVHGTTAKMYKQKGLGRARHGAKTAPIFVGGGKAFGPSPRDYSYRMPKKARRGAVRAALSQKQNEGKLLILDDFPMKAIKTKDAVGALRGIGVNSGLLVVEGRSENLEKSVRNINGIKLVRSEGINVYDIMRYEHTIILKDALAKVQEVLKP